MPSESYHHGDLPTALVAEAAAMIAEGGVESVTMREIGRRLGVSRAAPYRHFPDKASLLVAVARTGFARLRERLDAVQAGTPSPDLDRFGALGEVYVRFALENPAHYRLMYGREALTRQDVPELRLAANALFEELVVLCEAYQAAGSIAARDPRRQAYVAWGAVHGLASLLTDGQILAEVDVDALIDEMTRTLLEGMRS